MMKAAGKAISVLLTRARGLSVESACLKRHICLSHLLCTLFFASTLFSGQQRQHEC